MISLSLLTAEKTFPCDLCGEGYTSPYLLKVHKNKDHFNSKPYSCDFCGKAFNQKSCLRNHIRTHTGEKPFICNFCGKGFAQQNQLSTHIRKHTGITKFNKGGRRKWHFLKPKLKVKGTLLIFFFHKNFPYTFT